MNVDWLRQRAGTLTAYIDRLAPDFSMLRVSRNVLILLAISMLVNLATVPFIAFLARILGSNGFGEYGVILTYSEFARMFIDFGTGKLLTRDISVNGQGSAKIIGALMAPKPLLFAIAMAGGLSIGLLLGYASHLLVAVALGITIGALKMTAVAARSIFHANQQMEYDAPGMLAERAVTITVAVIAVQLGYGLTGVLVAFVCGSLVDALISWSLVLKKYVSRIELPTLRQAHVYFRDGVPLSLAVFFHVLYMRTNILILQQSAGNEATGWYNAAFQIYSLVLILAEMIALSVFPVLSRLAAERLRNLKLFTRQATTIMASLGGILALGIALGAGWAITFLFGQEYLPSIVTLRVLALGLPFVFASSVLAQALVAVHRQAIVGQVMFMAALVNIGLSLLLIGRYGAVGAAGAIAATEVLIFSQYLLAVIRFNRSSAAGQPIAAATAVEES